MKKQFVFLLVLGLFMSFGVYGDGYTSSPDKMPSKKGDFHHIYLGPEFFCYQVNTRVNEGVVEGSRFFSGFRLGYEFLKPKAFYAGVDIVDANSSVDFKVSKNGKLLSWDHADRSYFNWDTRFGYTFAPRNWLISSFLGLGVFGLVSIDNHNQGFQEGACYLSVGVRSKYIVSSYFDVGFNVKVLTTLEMLQIKSNHWDTTEYQSIWGGEFGIPLSWHLGSTKRWDLQIMPYLFKMDFTSVQNIYGTSILCGYRF